MTTPLGNEIDRLRAVNEELVRALEYALMAVDAVVSRLGEMDGFAKVQTEGRAALAKAKEAQ